MRVGDLVEGSGMGSGGQPERLGIIIEVISDIEVPPVCKILWSDGQIEKEWTDELELLNESR